MVNGNGNGLTLPEKMELALSIFKHLPIASTYHFERLFPGSRSKRVASEVLTGLADRKLVEGERLYFQKPKLWRPTSKGKKELGLERKRVELTTHKIDHYLAIGDVYMDLREMGGLYVYDVELREPFKEDGREYTFAPDVFAGFRGFPLLIEVQRSPKESEGWRKKWEVHEKYLGGEAWKRASWQQYRVGNMPHIYPRQIVVVTNQQEETVRQTVLPLLIVRHIMHIEGRLI